MYVLHSIWWESNTFSGVTCDWHLTLVILWFCCKIPVHLQNLYSSCYKFCTSGRRLLLFFFLDLSFSICLWNSYVPLICSGRVIPFSVNSIIYPRRTQHFGEIMCYIIPLVWRGITLSWISPFRITIKVYHPSNCAILNECPWKSVDKNFLY